MSLGDKFREFTTTCYKDQGIAFLNAYWDEINGDAELVWKWVHMFVELDLQNKEAGCDLDEFNAHRFLEKVQETRTVKELREQLKAIDLDFNKRMALLEYLCFRYKKTVADFVAKPQGDNSKEIEKAQAMIEEVQKALDAATAAAQAAKEAEAEAKSRAQAAAKAADEAASRAKEAARTQAEATRTADEAAARAAEATARADEAAAAEAEQRAALADVQSQEDARNNKIAELKAKSEDESTGIVARNKAKNELAQVTSEDPLPLRRAKITLEAATKKAAKAREVAQGAKDQADAAKAAADDAKAAADSAKAAADAAKAAADEAKVASEAAAAAAEESARQAEAAVVETERQLAEAQAFLDEVKAKSGSGQGSVWWLQRELEEKKKYMPKSRGGKW